MHLQNEHHINLPNQINNYQPDKTVPQSSDEDDSGSTQSASQSSAETENKSLKERERERKGCPAIGTADRPPPLPD